MGGFVDYDCLCNRNFPYPVPLHKKKNPFIFNCLDCRCYDCMVCTAPCGNLWVVDILKNEIILRNNLKSARTEKNLSQSALAEMVGVSRNTISSIETGQFCPTAKLALILCLALDKKFEELFYFD